MSNSNGKPRKPRRRTVTENATFGSFIPEKNLAALYCYRCALIGTLPALGLLFAPLAVACGVAGAWRLRQNPEARGENYILIGSILASVAFATDVVGVFFVVRGLNGG